MKGLNKLALATAVAAAPFATQAMEPMSDEAMGNTTGQAGVTIEMNTQMSIDQIEYSQGENTGSFLVNNVDIGGINPDAAARGVAGDVDLAIQVDLPEEGQTLDEFGSKAGQPPGGNNLTLNDGDALISVQSQGGAPVDLGIEMGANLSGNAGGADKAFQLTSSDGSESATLVSNLSADVFLTQLDIVARLGDVIADGDPTTGVDQNGSLEIEAAFAIDDLDADFDVAAVGIENMRMAGAGSMATLKGSSQGDGTVLGGGPAVVSMDIGQGATLSGNGPDNVLRINLETFQADIWMPTINIGSGDSNGVASIGSVGIHNLQVENTELAVYGRE